MALTFEIDAVLEFLIRNDGLHNTEEISERLGIPHGICQSIADFLSEYGFICTEGQWLRVNPRIKTLAPSHDLLSVSPAFPPQRR